MEFEITDRLNILGAEIRFIADGLSVLAARKEAELKQEKNIEIKKQLEEEATELNKISNRASLLGDSITLLAAELEAKINLEEINNDPIKLKATNLNLLSNRLIVLGDALAVQAGALEESSSNDTTAP